MDKELKRIFAEQDTSAAWNLLDFWFQHSEQGAITYLEQQGLVEKQLIKET